MKDRVLRLGRWRIVISREAPGSAVFSADPAVLLLSAVAESGLLAEKDWVPAEQILELAIRELGWAPGAPGYMRLADVLARVGVERHRVSPKRDDRRLPSGYWATDLTAAIENVDWGKEATRAGAALARRA